MDGDFIKPAKITSTASPGANPGVVRQGAASLLNWKQQARHLQKEAHVFYFAFKHPGVPWYAKAVAVCTAAYLFSPVQLIPSFIPVIGFLDDFLVLFLGVKLLRRIIRPDLLAECHQLAEAAELQRKEKIRSVSAVVGLSAVASLWLLAAVSAWALIATNIPH